MRNHNLRGTGTVFRYTVQQHYKTVSVIIFLAVLFTLAVAAFPLICLTSGGAAEVTSTEMTKLYLRNESGFPISAEDVHADERFAQLEIIETDASDDDFRQMLSDEDTAAAAVITADGMGLGFKIQGYYGEDGELSSDDVYALTDVLKDALHESRLRSLNVTQEQVDMVRAKVYSQVSTVADYRSGAEDQIDTATHMFANLFYSYMVLLLSALAMSYIFQLCMEEKVSKLVESLLVSVEPTALLAGKILAVTLFLAVGIGLVVLGLVISWVLADTIGDISFVKDFLVKTLEFDPAVLHISAGTVVLLVISVLLGYFVSAFFSGIIGSCCSKTEDTQQASLAVVLFILVGYMTGALTPAMESDAVNYFCSVFPLTSIFCALPNYVCGKIPLAVFILALALQLVMIYLLARLAGAVYRMMLLYRGSVPKPGQLIRMLKENHAAQKAAAGKVDSHGA